MTEKKEDFILAAAVRFNIKKQQLMIRSTEHDHTFIYV